MGERGNQHYVPQFYFRLFSCGKSKIHLLLKQNDRIILNSPIKGQCAENKFYGSTELETQIMRIESVHSLVIRRLIRNTWVSDPSELSETEHHLLLQAVLFQKARTSLQMQIYKKSTEEFTLSLFRAYLERFDDEESMTIAKLIDEGEVEVNVNKLSIIALQIETALNAWKCIADLGLVVLRNCTDIPFVFGDAPVVFGNQYLSHIDNRGTLGLRCAGLQIFYPLDSATLLMLYDSDIYKVRDIRGKRVDLYERFDISQLNAMQLNHSKNAIYFAEETDANYVSDLWLAHKRNLRPPRVAVERRDGWLVDGEPVDDLLLAFEPQSSQQLEFTFVCVIPARPEGVQWRERAHSGEDLFDE